LRPPLKIHSVKTNPRVAGRARLERAMREIYASLKDIIAVIDMPDDAESRFAFFRSWVDAIDDGPIADDASAGRLLRNIAFAITHAFEIGHSAGRGPPERVLHKRLRASRNGAVNSHRDASQERDKWTAVARRIMDADKSNAGVEKMADKICNELQILGLFRARRTVLNFVRAERVTRKVPIGSSLAS
jgi:hypothetical protein